MKLFIRLYEFLTFILTPLLLVLLIARLLKNKEDKSRFLEKLGFSDVQRPEGKLIWFHAASVGESISILPLVERMASEGSKILITSVTLTSANLIQKRISNFKGEVIHQFAPLDAMIPVRLFLKKWNPDIAIFVDSELWPVMLNNISCRKILINARISDRSFKRMKLFRAYSRFIMSMIDEIYPQSQTDSMKYEALGAAKIKMIGNLKLAAPSLDFDADELHKLSEKIGKNRLHNKKVIVAASTHAGEEEQILEVYNNIRSDYSNDIILIIVPRHPARMLEIKYACKQFFNEDNAIKIRSNNQLPDEQTLVYIADTIGELGIFYRLADVVILGGSFVDIGGHNPLEPAKLDNIIIVGNYLSNFGDIYKEMSEQNAVTIVSDLNIAQSEKLGIYKNHSHALYQSSKHTLCVNATANGYNLKDAVIKALSQDSEMLRTKTNALAFANSGDEIISNYVSIIKPS